MHDHAVRNRDGDRVIGHGRSKLGDDLHCDRAEVDALIVELGPADP
jgi:hypothetical protein